MLRGGDAMVVRMEIEVAREWMGMIGFQIWSDVGGSLSGD